MKKDYDFLDLKTLSFIGGQLSRDEPRFKIYSKLGFERARQYAALTCAEKVLPFLEKQDPDINDFIKLAKTIVEEIGIAELFPTLKELTRITMIQGDKTEWTPWTQK